MLRTLNSTPGPSLRRLLTYHSFQLEEHRNAKNVPTFCFKSALALLRFKNVPLTTNVKISLRARFCSPATKVRCLEPRLSKYLTNLVPRALVKGNEDPGYEGDTKSAHNPKIFFSLK